MGASAHCRSIARLICSAAVLFLAPLQLTPPADAYCPRITIHVNNEFFKSTYVVVGQALSERTQLDKDGFVVLWDYQVKVLTTYHGLHQQMLRIRTENNSGRFMMEQGKDYLLFVRTFEGHLRIDNCGNSAVLSDAQGAIDAIKIIAKAGPYGEIEARVSAAEDNLAGIRFT